MELWEGLRDGISPFRYKIQHVPGKVKVTADYLFRSNGEISEEGGNVTAQVTTQFLVLCFLSEWLDFCFCLLFYLFVWFMSLFVFGGGSNKDPFSSEKLAFLVPDFSVPHIDLMKYSNILRYWIFYFHEL